MPGVECELLLDVRKRERLMRSATHVGLAFVDDTAVGKRRADMAGEALRIRIFGIDLVAHRGGKREHRCVVHRRVSKVAETHIAA